MEIRKYLVIIQHWLWLLILGAVVGAGIAYIISIRQVKTYQSSTRVQVMSAPSTSNNYYSYFNDQQLAKTYIQTIKSRTILDAVEQRLGIKIGSGQIQTKAILETQLIDITVEDTDPQRAADIANTLVVVFAEINNQQQAERFMESEISLQAQLAQVDEQIQALQMQSNEASSAETEAFLTKAQDEINKLEGEILTLQGEIDGLTNRPRGEGVWATPTISPEQNLQLNEKELRLSQLQSTYDLYQQIYTNLVVLGNSSTYGTSFTNSDQLQSTLALYEQIRANLLSSYEDVRLSRLNSTSNIIPIEPATVRYTPVRPQTSRNVGVGFAVGLFLAAMVVFLTEYFDDTIKTTDQVTKELGLPIIGYIANFDHQEDLPYTLVNPRSPISESFRTLRTNLQFSGVDKPLKTLLVVSPNPAEGKSTISANLAVTISQGEKKVLLIDADLRRPRIHSFFGLSNRLGLSDLFINLNPVKDVIQRWKETNLSIITSGGIPPNPADLLSSKKMVTLIEEFKKYVDYIIVDAPPFLVADASILASHMDGVLLVIYPGKTPKDSVLSTIEQMNRVGANIVGVVMNRIQRNKTSYYARNSYYSSYYHDDYLFDQGKGKNKLKRKRGLFRKQSKVEPETPVVNPLPNTSDPSK